jgi:hypothetical protein
MNQEKRIVFMHIAKTAGTTLNQIAGNALGEDQCAFHIESQGDQWPALRDRRFISGHIRFHDLKSAFGGDDALFVSLLRHPVAHVISHIAWIRHLSDPGHEARLAAHADYIRDLSAKLAAIDLANPGQLGKLIAELTPLERGLLENAQTRYFCRVRHIAPLELKHLQTACRNLGQFDLIGYSEKMPDFLARLSSLSGHEFQPLDERLNSLGNKYGLTRVPRLVEALLPLIHYDMALYQFSLATRRPRAKPTASSSDTVDD